jgi:hypothetical protein
MWEAAREHKTFNIETISDRPVFIAVTAIPIHILPSWKCTQLQSQSMSYWRHDNLKKYSTHGTPSSNSKRVLQKLTVPNMTPPKILNFTELVCLFL